MAKLESTSHSHNEITVQVESLLCQCGFEVYPFKVCLLKTSRVYKLNHSRFKFSGVIGWYNAKVADVFRLPYDDDTLAYVIISKPDMFENAFLSYLTHVDCTTARDPLDQCMMHHFQRIKESFPEHAVKTIHDFEMTHTRRPRVLVQTAGHVAGAAYFYQRSDLKNDPWEASKQIFGVSVHPKYGGWFALRGIIVFESTTCTDLPYKDPPDCVSTDELRLDLLEQYNFHWQDWMFRDIIHASQKYSDQQKSYFATLPKDRKELLKSLIQDGTDKGLS